MKNCPFCNSSNITISYDYGDYAVCQSCGANGPHKIMATERAAISSWNQRKEDKVCVPECFIREDGKGFVVRKGGIDWDVWAVSFDDSHDFIATNGKVIDGGDVIAGGEIGRGDTIMQAVDNALAKVRKAESTEAAVQEGKREA